ncbi:hypothetical protein JTB14_038180 [Gonioctena quinquepunctata]|nr:hypothetical protein JTB14_038180 [Gonioctena quinquepunctata]
MVKTVQRQWIENVESTATLHDRPPDFILETARVHLTGAALPWQEARKDHFPTGPLFREEFEQTLIHEKNLTSLWESMQAEKISLYIFMERLNYVTCVPCASTNRRNKMLLDWLPDKLQ